MPREPNVSPRCITLLGAGRIGIGKRYVRPRCFRFFFTWVLGEAMKTDVIVLRKGWECVQRKSSKSKSVSVATPLKIFSDDKRFSPRTLGLEFGVTSSTVCEWIKRGRLEALPLPKGYRIMGRAVNEMLEKLKRERGQ